MAAWARDRAAGRQQLRCIGFPGDTGPAAPDLHHAPPARRGLVRDNTAAPARAGWAGAHQGCTPAEARRRAGGWKHMLAANARARLVRGAGARGRDLFRHRRLAPCRLAGPADPLGAAARSSATLRPAGPALYRSRPRPATDRAMVYPTLALVEVTFREVRDHLGVETQRQWSDRAIARTTPCLL